MISFTYNEVCYDTVLSSVFVVFCVLFAILVCTQLNHLLLIEVNTQSTSTTDRLSVHS